MLCVFYPQNNQTSPNPVHFFLKITTTMHGISICDKCQGDLLVIDALITCSCCGIVSGRSLDTRIQSFNSFCEAPSLYTRVYRFRTLCNELNGCCSFAPPLAKWMLENPRLLISPQQEWRRTQSRPKRRQNKI